MTRIVVIDDELDVREVLRAVLERAGFAVDTASSGAAGIELLESKGADLVITDVIMPGKNGVETVHEIRKKFPETRIIVISGGGNVTPVGSGQLDSKSSTRLASASAAATAAADADLTLTKPFDRCQILDAVNQLITN